MTDDFSTVPSGGCNAFASDSSLYHYSGGIRQTFYNFGGKWVKVSEQTYNTIPSNYICVDLSGISSNSQWYPLYEFIALFLVILCIGLFWYVLRRLLIWKI